MCPFIILQKHLLHVLNDETRQVDFTLVSINSIKWGLNILIECASPFVVWLFDGPHQSKAGGEESSFS